MGPDEPRYAQVAREMWQAGDWFTPTLDGHPWFEKPPLLYWLEIICYHIFGVSEFAARLGPALCGIGIAGALWWFGRTEDRGSSNLLALMTASTVGLIAFSHAAGFDVVLTLAVTAALTSFWRFERGSGRASALVPFYVFTGLAVLAKGLIGIFFPVAIVLLYLILRRRAPRAFLISLSWGVPLLLLIAVPWHVVMYMKHGSEFIDIYFVQHHFQRFTSNRYLHPQPFYFFLWVLPLMALPWTPFAVANVVRNIRERIVTSSPLLLFSLCSLAVPLGFFSFSGSKLPGYILPAVPPIVVLAWCWLRDRSRKWHFAGHLIGVLCLIISLALVWAFLPAYAARDSVKDLIATADSRGYAASRVLTLHMVSYNSEFYAAGRLLKNADGEQVMLEGAQLVLDEINKDGRPVLVLVPNEYTPQLTEFSKVTAEVLADNGRIAIIAVANR